MNVVLSDRAFEALKDAPHNVQQQAFEKHLRLPAGNIQHPSLRAEKYDEANDV